MNTAGIQIGDIGTGIVVIVRECNAANAIVPVDISAATNKQIIFKKPDGTVVIKDAAFKTTGVDGALIYATLAGDIDAAGYWQVQATVTLATGTWRTNVQGFVVAGNL